MSKFGQERLGRPAALRTARAVLSARRCPSESRSPLLWCGLLWAENPQTAQRRVYIERC